MNKEICCPECFSHDDFQKNIEAGNAEGYCSNPSCDCHPSCCGKCMNLSAFPCVCDCHATLESNFDKMSKGNDEANAAYFKKGDELAQKAYGSFTVTNGYMDARTPEEREADSKLPPPITTTTTPTVESWEKERVEVQSIVFRSVEAALEVVTANGVVIQVIHNGQSLPLST